MRVAEESLEFITNEIVGQEKWYFHPPDKSYMRLDKESKKMSSRVYGRYLPTEPNECKSNATKAMIAHWRANGSIDNHI